MAYPLNPINFLTHNHGILSVQLTVAMGAFRSYILCINLLTYSCNVIVYYHIPCIVYDHIKLWYRYHSMAWIELGQESLPITHRGTRVWTKDICILAMRRFRSTIPYPCPMYCTFTSMVWTPYFQGQCTMSKNATQQKLWHVLII